MGTFLESSIDDLPVAAKWEDADTAAEATGGTELMKESSEAVSCNGVSATMVNKVSSSEYGVGSYETVP